MQVPTQSLPDLDTLRQDRATMLAKSQDPQSTPERRKTYAAQIPRIDALIAQHQQQSATPSTQKSVSHPKPTQQPLRATTIRMQGGNQVKVSGASPTRYNPQIIIERVGEEPETMTPGECRSRFSTRLNELLESSAWQKQLLHELPNYATFQNACVYYAALTAHWQRPPTLSDLRFNHARFAEIFEIVTNYPTP